MIRIAHGREQRVVIPSARHKADSTVRHTTSCSSPPAGDHSADRQHTLVAAMLARRSFLSCLVGRLLLVAFLMMSTGPFAARELLAPVPELAAGNLTANLTRYLASSLASNLTPNLTSNLTSNTSTAYNGTTRASANKAAVPARRPAGIAGTGATAATQSTAAGVGHSSSPALLHCTPVFKQQDPQYHGPQHKAPLSHIDAAAIHG